MLFTAPAFLFLFLPLALIGYMLFGKGRRRACLLLICVVYHLLLNWFSPQNLLVLPLLILYTWFGGKLVERYRRSWLVAVVCILPYVALILCRNLAYVELKGFVYPIGLTVATMGSTSYLLESVRGNLPRKNRWLDLTLYLSFFPVMIVGPFIKYPAFLELTSEERIRFDSKNFAMGAKLYAAGFVKRIAIGAVLMETYVTFADFSQKHPDLLVTVFLLLLIYFSIWFVITGYSDMGCGIARMFGIELRARPSTPFHAAVPDEYCRSLLYSLQEWLDDYIIRPLRRITGDRFPHLIRAVAYGGCLLLFIRSSLYVLILAIPSVLIEYVVSRFRLEHRLAKHSGVRVLIGLLTMTSVSICWVFITMGDFLSILEYLSGLIFADSEYQIDLMLVSFSGSKYLFVILIGILLVLPGFGAPNRLQKRSPRGQAVARGAGTLLLFGLFVFTVLFFLPQYPIYDTLPFRYVYI